MAYQYDTLLKQGTVVDYVTGYEGVMDVAIKDGKIADVAPEIAPSKAEDVLNVSGYVVVPGIIDLHTHVSAWIGGRYGHKMLAKAGVTTTLDMAGPVESVLTLARDYGVGLNIATIEYVRPEHTVKDTNPDRNELQELLDKTLAKGAIGLKLLGGHYPLTPEATARAIEVANNNKAYVAIHCGTLTQGSNIEGFHQAVQLAEGRSLHIAHINSYTRGLVRTYMQEAEEAIAALIDNPNIRSEAYLSPINGTSAKCSNGAPESLQTKKCLQAGGFAPTEAGFAEAILAGWAQINMEAGGQMVLVSGQQGVDYWVSKDTDTTVSFNVNPPEPRLRLAAAKRPDGQFVVDCISTDGGGIPRNSIIEMGLSLVKLQALTMKEFVQKSSYNPAGILGLSGKGHFRPGADADITVIDYDKQQAHMTIVGGNVVMLDGFVCGKGSSIVTTAAGESSVRKIGLQPIVVDLANSLFYQARSK